MPMRSARRPLPALIFLLALAVLAAIVWYRVVNRSDAQASKAASPGACATASVLPPNSAVTVNVLNGTSKTGLAKTTLDGLVALGFKPGNVNNAPSPLTQIATVTSGPTGASAAKLVSLYIPGSTLATDTRTDSSVTVTVGQQFTGLATAAAVKAAMSSAKLSQAAVATAGSPTARPTC